MATKGAKGNSKSTKSTKLSYYQRNKEKCREYQRTRYAEKIKPTLPSVIEKMKDINPTNTRNINTFGISAIDGYGCGRSISDRDILNQYRSWIYVCATYNGSAVANAPLRLYATTEEGESTKFLHKTRSLDDNFMKYLKNESSRKSLARIRRAESAVEIVDHPILDLLQNINDFNNNFESFELSQIYMDLIGDAYWYIVRDSMGTPQSIWVLQSQHVKIVPGKGKSFIKGYLLGGNNINESVKFSESEIIHFKTPNPNNMYYGMGCGQAIMATVIRMNAMDKSEQARLDNMGRPDFVVGYKNGKLDSSEIKRIEHMWNRSYGGPNKDGKIKVMDEDFELKTLGFKPRDMEYLSGRTWGLTEIAAAFGVPKSILDSSDAKKATSEIADINYARQTLTPRLTRIQEKLNEKLVPMYDPSGRMFLMYDSVIPVDRLAKIKENCDYVESGVKSINEVRAEMGLKPFDDEKYDKPFAKGAAFNGTFESGSNGGNGKIEMVDDEDDSKDNEKEEEEK